MYTEFHFTDFMSAVAHWRKDRRGNPTIIYPEVLTILHGKEHDCTECALSGRCQPEHACCRAYLLDHLVAIGWATNHRMGGIQLTDYYGKMAYLLTTNGGEGGVGGGFIITFSSSLSRLRTTTLVAVIIATHTHSTEAITE